MDDSKRKMLRFKSKVDQISGGQNNKGKINFQREKLIAQLKKLEGDILLWENNIGFFARSKNADSMIRDVQKNIQNAREEIKLLEEKINLIDNLGQE
jgi:peptidoglycan hydrolase CwlO-like protein